jgi:hypothetical protein
MKNAISAPAIDHASAYEDLKMTGTNYTLHYSLMTDLGEHKSFVCTRHVL